MRLFASAAASAALLLASCSGSSDGRIESSGTIEGTDVNIGVEVGGKVLAVRVDEGSRVAPGDTLVVVDDAEYQIQLRQALANLASFESAYRLAVEGSRKEDIVQAEAAFRTAETDFARMKALLAEHSVTQKSYDDAYARYVAAEQTYRKLKSGLRPEEIQGARVRRDQAAAQADLLRKRVRDCHVISPSAGVITLRGVEPGELVNPGMTVLRLTYLDRVKLMIYVNEADLGNVRLGQTAQITIDSFGKGKSVEGSVTYISPVAEFTPKNVQTKEERTKLVFGVRIEAANPDGALKPGLPADAVLLAAGKVR
ncbi:MAG TPA: efflux RND transporter periplasmic adaptor subunit [Bacteroidota bacterium]|nr:efflux RND transporter periplasmic adaptor subunit [Bacteroidota bacterium]